MAARKKATPIKQRNGVHPAAEEWPLLEDDAFESLVESMRKDQFKGPPIVRWRGQIVDGRNRERAARVAGVTPIYDELADTDDPWRASWRLNGARRDMSESQKAAISVTLLRKSKQWQAEVEAAVKRANQARAEAAKAQHAVSNPRKGEKSGQRHVSPTIRGASTEAQVFAAATGLGAKTLDRVLKVEREAPERLPAISRGETSAPKVLREIKPEAPPKPPKPWTEVDRNLAIIKLRTTLQEFIDAWRWPSRVPIADVLSVFLAQVEEPADDDG